MELSWAAALELGYQGEYGSGRGRTTLGLGVALGESVRTWRY
jgi:hypothetical protein